ncbi:MAG: CPBP family intramembrane metalloprotease [Micrococcales bacterium]|nr:CPBP family intramembrane metalloprotease [Micrococcales bacterium]
MVRRGLLASVGPWSPGLVPALLVGVAAVLALPFRLVWAGWAVLALAVGIAWWLDRLGRTTRLGRDITVIAVGLAIVSSVSVAADISWGNYFRLGGVFAAAVMVPYLLSRYLFDDDEVRFPWRGRWPWSRLQWGYIGVVIVAGYLLLPFYFISSGVWENWPAVHEWHEVARLFVGVNVVGTWDELFFICTVFALYLRHFPMWQANTLQAMVFIPFLWELGYQAWGPALTIPFALLQGWLFRRTRALAYVVTVHLLFDLVVFGVIVHARNPGTIPIFLL